MSNIAVARVKRELKEVIKSEEVCVRFPVFEYFYILLWKYVVASSSQPLAYFLNIFRLQRPQLLILEAENQTETCRYEKY